MGSKRKRNNREPSAPEQSTQKRSKPSSSSKELDKSPFALNLSIEERRREHSLYELLGSEDVGDRINAADAIVSGLLNSPEPVLLRHLEKRLFRGLASGRNASRLGFSLVLTEILGQLFGSAGLANKTYTGLTFEKVLNILVEKTSPGGGSSSGAGGIGGGQAERDHYFGQVFGIECFVRSGILWAEEKRWEAVLQILLKLMQKKSWLRSQCGWIIVQAVQYMSEPAMVEETLLVLIEEGIVKTPEGVGIWIVALDKFPDLKLPKASPWRNPLATTTLQSLPPVLKDSGRDTSNQNTSQNDQQSEGSGKKGPKQANWTAQLHFVWDLIVAHYAKLGKSADAAAAEQFRQFWERVVDQGFFSKSASDSQKFSGFMIFQKMLEGASSCPFILDALFSKNLMGCLMNQAAKEDRFLHRAALKALKAIEAAVEKDPSFLPAVLKQLLGGHGAYNFDQRTNTKTVDKILQFTTPSTVKAVIKTLKLKDASKSGLDDEAKYYQALGGYLFRLANVPSENDGESAGSSKSVPGTAITLLAELAYSNKSVPEGIKEALRTRTTSAFARLVKRPEDFGHLCNAILSIETDLNPEDEVATLVLPQAYERLKDLLEPVPESTGKTKGGKTTAAAGAPRQALALLYAVGILQFYNEEPDVVDLFDELDECYTKLSKEDKEEEEEGVAEYLVEILLAMVARPSSLMRQVSQQVFEAFTSLMTSEALKLLTDPLAADESEKGQQALFSTEDEDMADAEAGSDDEDEDEEGLDSDVELVDLEDAGSEVPDVDSDDEASDSDSNDDKSDDDEEEDETTDKNQEELDALDNALASVLKSHRLDKDVDAPDDDSDGSDMTDSEMMAVDQKLAEIFKQRAKTTSKKKEKKDAKDTVVNFKHRVLDLLNIYAKNEAARMNPLVFEIMLPLLHLVRTTTVKALGNRGCEVILALSGQLKKARGMISKEEDVVKGDIDTEELMALLEEIHEEASKDPSHAFARAVSTASLAVASVLLAASPSTVVDKGDEDEDDEGEENDVEAGVFGLYAATQRKWFNGEVKIQASFFSDWLNWCQSHAAAAVAAKEAAFKEAVIKKEAEKREKDAEKKEKKEAAKKDVVKENGEKKKGKEQKVNGKAKKGKGKKEKKDDSDVEMED
ncbi:DNA polymerase V [Rhypophila sp. PSN 637]